MYIIITVVCVWGGTGWREGKDDGWRNEQKKTIEISAPDFFAHTESLLQTSEDECFAAWESARLKRTQVRDVGRMREYTYTYMYKKDLYFWKYDYTNLRQKNKNYANENYEVLLPLLICLLVCFGWVFLLSGFILENKTNTRAMELGG